MMEDIKGVVMEVQNSEKESLSLILPDCQNLDAKSKAAVFESELIYDQTSLNCLLYENIQAFSLREN